MPRGFRVYHSGGREGREAAQGMEAESGTDNGQCSSGTARLRPSSSEEESREGGNTAGCDDAKDSPAGRQGHGTVLTSPASRAGSAGRRARRGGGTTCSGR